MTVRATIATAIMNFGRSIGRAMGCEVAVELSDHSIDMKMQVPDKDQKAWDENLYKKGNVFYHGYANPIKPRVQHHEGLENPDEIHSQVATVETDGGDDVESFEEKHCQMISSPRYRDYMTQDLISQLLTPDERWKLLAFAVLFVAFLAVINILVSLSAAGVL